MLLYHEVEGTAKPVPPGVKHIITSSNLPAPKCAKLKESTADTHVISATSTEVQVLSCSRKEKKHQRKGRAGMPQVPEARTMPTAMQLWEREKKNSAPHRTLRCYTHSHTRYLRPSVPCPCFIREATACGCRGMQGGAGGCTAHRCWLRVTT